MPIQIREGRLFRMPMRTRMPFRYGIATLTELPHIFLQLQVVVDGAEYTGISADHLAPKWFTKNPQTTPAEDISEMLLVIRQALDFAMGMEAETPFALWRMLYDSQAEWGKPQNLAPLLTNFGVSLVERAMLDAFCRAKGKSFATLLRENAFQIVLDSIHPELAGKVPADYLPSAPLPFVFARHTVGMADPLTEAEITEETRLQDGLPQSLEANIHAYGLRHFKLKIGGKAEEDVERLLSVLQVISTNVPNEDWAFSMDGNESYHTANALDYFLKLLAKATLDNKEYHRWFSHLLFIEQPLHRSVALSPNIKGIFTEIGRYFAEWSDVPSLIIDESDGSLTDFPTALELGYDGTSYKNCKGIFKGIANTCLARQRGALLSGEDLSTVGPVSLLQDLAAQSALGIESVERNGHHYFVGLSMFPTEVQHSIITAHPDLYHISPQGFPTLTITRGEIALGTVNSAPFGLAADFEPAGMEAL